MYYFGNKEGLAQYVNGMLSRLEPGSAWTMTISQAKSGEYCALGVTEELSDGTVLLPSY